ncbi:MAG: hypothetical protein KJO98_02095 [Rhodothermia bacterium]|nr:hypothetical protein [Rhodothermia bacterium]
MGVLILTFAVFVNALPDEDFGRKGNQFYGEGKYREAADAYLSGLEQLDDDASAEVRAAFLNNLGAALYRLDVFDGAQSNFIQSFSAADSDQGRTRAAYNAGNAAYRQENLKAALAFYKQSLLADPTNESARFNFEFLARRLEGEQESPQQQSENRIDPSEYAKALKEQAERLVAETKYREAYDLMIEGLKVDETVQAFQTFIGRTGKVADINQTPAR